MSIKTLLVDEIKNEIQELSRLEVGSEKYITTVEGITKLTDRVNDMEKISNDHREKIQIHSEEMDVKLRELADERIDRYIKNGLTCVSIVGGFVLTIWGTQATFEFEKEGTITTIMGRGFINKLLFKK